MAIINNKSITRLSDREKEDYLKMVMDISETADIDWLIGSLLFARAKQRRELTAVTFKICDPCSWTFPFYTINCQRCGNGSLREFSVSPNYDEILDGLKKV